MDEGRRSENAIFYAAVPGRLIRGIAAPPLATTLRAASESTMAVFGSCARARQIWGKGEVLGALAG